MNTQTTVKPGWLSEFGFDWQVPAEFTSGPKLRDDSWHNDICPKFTLVSNERITLWSDHPEVDQREMGGKRFVVTEDENTLLETDDLQTVLSFLETF